MNLTKAQQKRLNAIPKSEIDGIEIKQGINTFLYLYVLKHKKYVVIYDDGKFSKYDGNPFLLMPYLFVVKTEQMQPKFQESRTVVKYPSCIFFTNKSGHGWHEYKLEGKSVFYWNGIDKFVKLTSHAKNPDKNKLCILGKLQRGLDFVVTERIYSDELPEIDGRKYDSGGARLCCKI